MGVKIKDILNLRFGRLIVQSIISGKGQQTIYSCLCDCGNTHTVKYRYLNERGTKSCGCLAKEALLAFRTQQTLGQTTHRGSSHPLYNGWVSMVRRASKPSDKDYHRYGAIGRDICERWADPLTGFWSFVEDMGPKPDPTYSIERLDNNLGYSPENCVWADKTAQVFNRNYSKRPGVNRSENGKRWVASMSFKGVMVLNKTVDTFEEALLLREEAELKYYGNVWAGHITE